MSEMPTHLVGLHAEAVWKPVCRTPRAASLSRLGVAICMSSVQAHVSGRAGENYLGAESANITESKVICDDLDLVSAR